MRDQAFTLKPRTRPGALHKLFSIRFVLGDADAQGTLPATIRLSFTCNVPAQAGLSGTLRTTAYNGLVSQRAAYARFIAAHPEYAATSVLDELRQTEYSRLDAEHHVYLDYTGGSLHAASQ